jgi:ribosomal protein S18 acetylase RimI-like enzyme
MESEISGHRTQRTRIDWVCIRGMAWSGDSFASRTLSWVLAFMGRFVDRVTVQRFVRFELRPADVDTAPSDVHLTPLNEEIIARLRRHPDAVNEAFASGLNFWDMGVRNGFVWFDGDEPLCFQWQLTEPDLWALRARSEWGNLYPHLSGGMAQREKLWVFSAARRKGIASRFAGAMLHEARTRGVTTLVTHVSEANAPALALVERSGWKRCGTIVRYEFDVPVLRNLNSSVAVHLRSAQAGSARARMSTPQKALALDVSLR